MTRLSGKAVSFRSRETKRCYSYLKTQVTTAKQYQNVTKAFYAFYRNENCLRDYQEFPPIEALGKTTKRYY